MTYEPTKLSPGELIRIYWDVRDGIASPEDAKRVLADFCARVDSNEVLPPQLLEFLRNAFLAFLSGDASLQTALGLARKRGRPTANEERNQVTAAEVLRCRLEGNTLEVAAERVSKNLHRSETQVREAWAAYKQDAVILLRIERSLESYPWTADEIERLTEIYAHEPGFIAPGKSWNYPA